MRVYVKDTGYDLRFAREPREAFASGLLIRGQLRIDGVEGFDLPRTHLNQLALGRSVAPDDALQRPPYLEVTCDTGPYDRLYVDGVNAGGYQCRLVWSQHPLRLANEAYLHTLKLGVFEYGREQIQAARASGPVSWTAPTQAALRYPDADYGQLAFDDDKARPYIPTLSLRPWISTAWLIRRAFAGLGVSVEFDLGQAGAVQRDIDYHLSPDAGAGTEQEQSVRLADLSILGDGGRDGDAVDGPLTTLAGIREGGVHPFRTITGASLPVAAAAPLSGVYSIEVSGVAFASRNAYQLDTGRTEGYQIVVRVTAGIRGRLVREYRAEGSKKDPYLVGPEGNEPWAHAHTWSFSVDAWLTEGEYVQVLVDAPPGQTAHVSRSAFSEFFAESRGDRVQTRIFVKSARNYAALYDATGDLRVNLTCTRSWLRDGQRVELASLLNPATTLLDILKGYAHLYALRLTVDPGGRSLYMRPVDEVTASEYADDVTVEPYFRPLAPPVVLPGMSTEEPIVTFAAGQRSGDVTVGFASGNNLTDFIAVSPRNPSDGPAKPYKDPNPTYDYTEQILRTLPYYAPRPPVAHMKFAEAATGMRRAYILDIGEAPKVEWDIAPRILRWYGADGDELPNTDGEPSLPARVVDHDDIGPDGSFPQLRLPAHAGHIADHQLPGTYAPLTYGGERGLYAAFWVKDFAARYSGAELAVRLAIPRSDARDVDARLRAIVVYEGRPVPARVVAVEAVADGRADVRLVVDTSPGLGEVQAPPDLPKPPRPVVNVTGGVGGASATFDLPADVATEFTVQVGDGAEVAYTPGAFVDAGDATVTFRVVATNGAGLTGSAVGRSPSLPGGNCGAVPALRYTYDADAGTAKFFREGFDTYAALDTLTLSVDGGSAAAYTEGDEVTGFTDTAVVTRTVNAGGTCPDREVSVTVNADEATTATPTLKTVCADVPVIVAREVGNTGRYKFSVEAGSVSGDPVLGWRVRIGSATHWTDYRDVPVPGPGKVALTIFYESNCPPKTISADYG